MSILTKEQLNNIISEYKRDCVEFRHFQGDWWTAIKDKWDVNVYEVDEEATPYKMGITLYRIDENGKTDFSDFHSNVAYFDASEFAVDAKVNQAQEEHDEYISQFIGAEDPVHIVKELINLGERGAMLTGDDFCKVRDLAKLLKKII